MTESLRNWAGNLAYRAAQVHRPATLDELRQVVAASPRLRALGSRHSFNDVADTGGTLVSMERLNRVLAIDPERRTVTVEGGARYGELGRELQRAGFALHNLASLPHISVAGACATATHGSGEGNKCLAGAVVGLELVMAEGDLVALTRERDGDELAGAVVSLGALGVVARMTLAIEPTFEVRQLVYERLPAAQLESHFDAIMGAAYSVSFFSDWNEREVSEVWLKQRADAPAALDLAALGATPSPTHRHPIIGLSPENCTPQMGESGPWHERLPHFQLEFTPSAGAELQTEYLVPRQHALAALRAVGELRDQIAPLLLVTELRSIAADDLWLSPFYQQPCLGMHFTWQPEWPGVRALLPQIEERLAPFGARPHWGKLFTMAPERVRALYPRLLDFQRLAARYDPQGKFRNEFVEAYLF